MSLRILIIDADLSFIVRLRKALVARKHIARTERRPLTKMHHIAHESYDIAIVDRQLDEFFTVVSELQHYHPDVPLLISGKNQSDAEVVPQVGAQGYINKPYVARDLIAIIEFTFAQIARQPQTEDEWQESQPEGEDEIPRPAQYFPQHDDNTTIGEILNMLLGDEIDSGATQIFETIDDDEDRIPEAPPTLPESTTRLQRTDALSVDEFVIEEPPIKPGDSMASQALRLANDETEAEHALFDAARAVEAPKVKALPSWSKPPSEQDAAHVEDLIGELPMMVLPRYDTASIEDSPQAAYTQPTTLPEIDIIPEDETGEYIDQDQVQENFLDVLANAASEEDTRLQEALRNYAGVKIQPEAPESEHLIDATVEEITQSMGIVFDEESRDEFEAGETEGDVVARAAFRLTQLSLESTALGSLLTQGHSVITRQGELEDSIWREIIDEIANAWEQGSSSNTRLLYRKFDKLGQLLLFSTRTINNLTLTMIFGSNTPLKVIRRQAKRIVEALLEVPQEAEYSAEAPLDQDIAELAESTIEEIAPVDEPIDLPPAAVTNPSRPTDLHPPDGLQESVAPIIEAEAAAEVAPQREAGTYAGYACLWLVQSREFALNESLGKAMYKWLRRSAEAEDWDLIDADIRSGWVNLHIEVPVKTLPSTVVEHLMADTATALRDAIGWEGDDTPWSSSYSVLTPGRLLNEREIEAFIRFYTGA